MDENKESLYKRDTINYNIFQYLKFNWQETFERLKSENLA